MTQSNYTLKGILQHTRNQNSGRIYQQDTFKELFEEYKRKLKAENREEAIDSILENREYNPVDVEVNVPYSSQYDGVDIPNGSYSITDIRTDGETLIVDMNMKPELTEGFINMPVYISSRKKS